MDKIFLFYTMYLLIQRKTNKKFNYDCVWLGWAGHGYPVLFFVLTVYNIYLGAPVQRNILHCYSIIKLKCRTYLLMYGIYHLSQKNKMKKNFLSNLPMWCKTELCKEYICIYILHIAKMRYLQILWFLDKEGLKLSN